MRRQVRGERKVDSKRMKRTGGIGLGLNRQRWGWGWKIIKESVSPNKVSREEENDFSRHWSSSS